MPEKEHEHEWTLYPFLQDTRCCKECKRVEVFVNNEWRWQDEWFEKSCWRKISDEEMD
jgi:hypothetical protein